MNNLTKEALEPTVSVVIPVYGQTFIEGCLEALTAQTYPRALLQLIVVNNNSATPIDATLIARYRDVAYIEEARVGAYAARNAGIRISNGSIIAFTDADCMPDANWIQNGVEKFSANVELSALGGRVVTITRADTRMSLAEMHDIGWGFPQDSFVNDMGFAATANFMIRKCEFTDIGLFNDEMVSGGDMELGRRLCAAGKKMIYADNAVVYHRARVSLGSVLTKYRRTAAGELYLGRSSGKTVMSTAIHFITRPVRTIRYLQARNQSLIRKELLVYLILSTVFGYIQVLELLRLALGKEPCRE